MITECFRIGDWNNIGTYRLPGWAWKAFTDGVELDIEDQFLTIDWNR